MSAVDAEPRPGTAFRTVVEESYYLNVFINMVIRYIVRHFLSSIDVRKELTPLFRLEIDLKRLAALREWQHAWDPEWTSSGIALLINPLLGYFNEGSLEPLPRIRFLRFDTSFLSVHAWRITFLKGFTPLAISDPLERAYSKRVQCEEMVNGKNASKAFMDWWQNAKLPHNCFLPEIGWQGDQSREIAHTEKPFGSSNGSYSELKDGTRVTFQ
ncbi:hypothetical protein M408DRAFT_9164 [Serendipita vermifera MAFF 305830]|uniref:Uncharacterized protein n=1 Tax=Serendipita vermifera MAFF 305830 TaxID=933852 RepID=A0A0C3B6B7_SERVB|nr:hypothetical protein M408DRAFT_9164 [Serendipita vermifera MAFF 305830]